MHRLEPPSNVHGMLRTTTVSQSWWYFNRAVVLTKVGTVQVLELTSLTHESIGASGLRSFLSVRLKCQKRTRKGKEAEGGGSVSVSDCLSLYGMKMLQQERKKERKEKVLTRNCTEWILRSGQRNKWPH